MSGYVLKGNVMLLYVVSCHGMSSYVMSCHVMSRQVWLSYLISCHVQSCCRRVFWGVACSSRRLSNRRLSSRNQASSSAWRWASSLSRVACGKRFCSRSEISRWSMLSKWPTGTFRFFWLECGGCRQSPPTARRHMPCTVSQSMTWHDMTKHDIKQHDMTSQTYRDMTVQNKKQNMKWPCRNIAELNIIIQRNKTSHDMTWHESTRH